MLKPFEERGPWGQFLYRELKDARNHSAQWLAQGLKRENVSIDASLIRRWMSGSRIPPDTHPAISKIAKLLNVSEELVFKIHEDALNWQNAKKAVAKKEKQYSKDKNSKSNKLLEKDIEIDSQSSVITDSRSELNKNAKSVGIKGAQEVLETAISLIENLPNPQCHGDQLLLMIQGRMTTIEQFSEVIQQRWNSAIKLALQKGWKVTHIVRLDNNIERVKRIVRSILLLAGNKGEYIPYAFKQKYVSSVAQSLLLVPRLNEGMVFYAGKQSEYADSAIYIKDKLQIEILSDYFDQIKSESNEIFHTQKRYNSILERMERADKIPSRRIVILKRLSDIQRPFEFYDKNSEWAKAYKKAKDIVDSEDLEYSLEGRRKRQNSLLEHSVNYSCRYIYTRQCIGNFADSGREVSLPGYVSSIKSRISQLQHLRDFLDLRNYEMCLSEEEIAPSLKGWKENIEPIDFDEIIPDFCEVQEGKLVLMQFTVQFDDDNHYECKWIVINEPIIVRAFYEHLSEIWNEFIPDERKRRHNISRWIESKIDELKIKSDEIG